MTNLRSALVRCSLPRFYRLIRYIVERTRAGVLLVEQMTDLALEFATRAYVLDRGRVVQSGPSQVVAMSPQVRSAYLGEN